MDSWAGASAVEQYLAARVQRRRRGAVIAVLLPVAAALTYTAWRSAGAVRMGTVAAGIGCLAAAWTLRPESDPERWLRGARGEAATAGVLDRLPPRRWIVRHDLRIPGSRANLDHLVIGPSGVWVIDTKTTRARVRVRWRAVYFGDRRLDPASTAWEADVVSDRLGVRARPLIAVPGQGLRRRGGRCGRVRVLPLAGLNRRIQRGRRRLRPGDVAGLGRQAEAVFRPASPVRGKRAAPRG
jgi:hypothetical protein